MLNFIIKYKASALLTHKAFQVKSFHNYPFPLLFKKNVRLKVIGYISSL